MKLIPLRDVTVNGQRYIEKISGIADFICGRECTFNRRGGCWIKDHLGDGYDCHRGNYWTRVDEEGYLIDRDGWRGFMGCPESLWIRIDSERYVIDKDGNRKLNNRGKEYKI